MSNSSSPPGSQPNILFFLIDDMGWADLGCYGSTFYETPRLDRLAREGMSFTNAYASCPVCSPTRASIMTGKYPANVGITNYIPGNAWGKLMGVPYFHELPGGETTIAQALGEGGYRTWHVGKWHLGGEDRWPDRVGFDHNIGGCSWGLPKQGYFSPYGCPTLEDGPEGEYLTDRLTDEAISLLKDHQAHNAQQPFFMNFAHYAVHTPIQAPAELVQKYEQKAKDLGLDQQPTFEEGEPFAALHKKDQRIRRRLLQSHPVYAAMVENLDTNIGRVLDTLDELGLAEDTMVVFTSDNGGLSTAEGSSTCNAPLSEGKGWMYEGGTREPMIVRWPHTVEAGSTCSTPVTSPDFYPTWLEAAGLPPRPDQHEDGVSIMGLITGTERKRANVGAHVGGNVGGDKRGDERGDERGKEAGHPYRGRHVDDEAVFWHYPHYSNQGGTPGCSVRLGDWKLIEFFEDDKLELYNLVDDPGEDCDLAGDMPDKREELHRRLVAWRDQIEAKIPQPNPDYEQMLAGEKPCPNGDGKIPGDDHE